MTKDWLVHPNATDTLNNKDIIIEKLGKSYFDEGPAADVNNAISTLSNKGIGLEKLGKSKEAISHYDKVPAADVNDTDRKYISALSNKGIGLCKALKNTKTLSPILTRNWL